MTAKKHSTAFVMASVAGAGLVGAGVYLFTRTKPSKPAPGKPSTGKPGQPSTGIPEPPPGAVESVPWSSEIPTTENTPEPGTGGAGGAPSTPPPAGQGGAPSFTPIDYRRTVGGTTMALDAGAFMMDRFMPLPAAQRPTSTQAKRITIAFTGLGVGNDGWISQRPTIDAMNATLDLAGAFDLEGAPATVSAAVREFAQAAWALPIPLTAEKKA